MPDEKDDQDNPTEDIEQPDPALDETLPDELPDDPVELKKVAETAISQAKSAKQTIAALQSDKERVTEDLEEARTGKHFFFTKSQDLEAQLKAKGKEKESPKADEKGLRDDSELADAVTSGMTLADIDSRAAKVAQRIVREATENLTKQGAVANAMTNEYPDLRDSNSALAKATIAEMEKLDSEIPGMSDAAKFELATRRSAGRLNIAPRTTSNGNGSGKTNPEEAERARRRTGQGGPTGKPAAAKGAIVITDQDRKDAARMNGGQPLDDKYIIAAKKNLQEQRQQQDQRSRA